MKKLILIIVCVILMVIPIHISNTTVMEIDMVEMNERIRIRILENKIEEEYRLFHEHMASLKNACFVDNFFSRVVDEAIASKSLPSVTIAQAAIETGYGKSNKLQNNIFGIKGRGIRATTHEVYKGRWVKINANFQYFPTLKDAFNKHYEILHRYGARGYDHEQWINRIVRCGYATDPMYSHKIRFVINKYGLVRLDRIQKYKSELNRNTATFVPDLSYITS